MENKFLVMITKNGVIKKTEADSFTKIRSTGIRAVGLKDDDELAFCLLSSGKDSIVIATSKGQGIHFKEDEVRAMGRQAGGVRGIKLRKGDFVVGLEVIGDTEKTMDLLFDALTLIQTKKIEQVPVVLVGREYWQPWRDWLKGVVLKKGCIDEKDRESVFGVDFRANINFFLNSILNAIQIFFPG
jgi:DNA gyrase/topoisomerase IV subunit A